MEPQPLGKELIARVKAHYANSREPLLLSTFGKSLRVEGLWPVANEARKLWEVIEAQKPEIDILRDPKSPSYAVVVSKDYEHIGKAAVSSRVDRTFLQNLPRSLILAFVIEIGGDQKVYVQLRPPFRYERAVQPPGLDFVEIEEQYRQGGLVVYDIESLDKEHVKNLADGIRGWCGKHDISLEIFYKKDLRTERHIASTSEAEPVATVSLNSPGNALERLHAAQPAGVARRMVIPIDIALLLTKVR